MDEFLTNLETHLKTVGGGSFAISYDKDQFVVAYHFGKEAEDSDMAGGAAYGVGDTLAEALATVKDECRL